MTANLKNIIKAVAVREGFTLVELIVASALILTASAIGIIGFRQYSTTQKMNNAVMDVVLYLQKAKSRAQSQAKPGNIAVCLTNALSGYEVRICNITGSKCAGSGRYELHVICGINSGLIEFGQLPSGLVFDTSSQANYFFPVLNGGANQGTLTITGSGFSKSIQVSPNGIINVL